MMMNYKLGIRSKKRGFSLAETVVVVAVMGILFAVTFGVFQNLNQNKALEKDTVATLSVLAEARSLTLASKNSKQYGVHFATNLVTLFQGSSYSASEPTNVGTAINSLVRVSAISLTGGGSDVVFERLTGKTSESGTITLSLAASPSVSKTVTIYLSGLSE